MVRLIRSVLGTAEMTLDGLTSLEMWSISVTIKRLEMRTPNLKTLVITHHKNCLDMVQHPVRKHLVFGPQ